MTPRFSAWHLAGPEAAPQMHRGRMIEAIRPISFVCWLYCALVTRIEVERLMTWIKTVRMDEDERVKQAMEAQRKLYPVEYATPVASVDGAGDAAGIIAVALP